MLAQPRSQQASSSSSWQCSSLQAAYQAALLQYGDDPADLQHLIATFASAVLRVSQSLGSAAGQLLQQRAFSAADQVHSQLGSLQRDQQLLAVARKALACAATPEACLQQPENVPQQHMREPQQDLLQQPVQEQLGHSWRQPLKQVKALSCEDDGNDWQPLFS